VPFYEYRRPDGTTLEVMQKMSDPPLTEDPETGVPLERIFHPIAVHFKGKGFYNTDYGTKNRQREKAAEEGSKKSDSGSGDGSSSETKTAGDSGASSSSGDSGSSSSGDSGSSSSGDSGSSSSGDSGSSSSGDSGASSSKSPKRKSAAAKPSSD
jgi:predicted nucleic acid-binding Zn ribbon protein